MTEAPNLIVLAGPNGAGKTTASRDLLEETLHVYDFVNADEIAKDLAGDAPETVSIQAGRLMLLRLRELTAQRKNVAFESTLSSRSFAPWIRESKATGYSFSLFYFWLPSPEMAIDRVRRRKRLGGHSVPDDDIRRRYHRGVNNFFELYRPLVTEWEFYDSTERKPLLIATGEPEIVYQPEIWSRIKERSLMASTLTQTPADRPIREILKDRVAIQAALDRGYYRAVLRHRAGNVPMINMRDGKIVEIDANDIVIPPEILAQIQES